MNEEYSSCRGDVEGRVVRGLHGSVLHFCSQRYVCLIRQLISHLALVVRGGVCGFGWRFAWAPRLWQNVHTDRGNALPELGSIRNSQLGESPCEVSCLFAR